MGRGLGVIAASCRCVPPHIKCTLCTCPSARTHCPTPSRFITWALLVHRFWQLQVACAEVGLLWTRSLVGAGRRQGIRGAPEDSSRAALVAVFPMFYTHFQPLRLCSAPRLSFFVFLLVGPPSSLCSLGAMVPQSAVPAVHIIQLKLFNAETTLFTTMSCMDLLVLFPASLMSFLAWCRQAVG